MEAKLLGIIKKKKDLKGILEKCSDGSNKHVIANGLECPYCGCLETYKDRRDPNNTDKWYFMIRAFRVDSSSECKNCEKWFDLF